MDKFIHQKINGKLYLWNYSKLIQNKDINENKYFVTNNFVERTNKTLNENLIYKKSSFINFRNSILSTDIYFENKSGYKLNNPNLSKSIVYYLNNSNYYDKNKKVKLINYQILKNIYNTYTNFVKQNGLEMFDNIEDEDFIQENNNETLNDDEYSDSCKEEEEESDEEKENIFFKNKDNDDDDKNPPGDGNNNLNKKKEIIYPKKNQTKSKSKSKSKNNYKNKSKNKKNEYKNVTPYSDNIKLLIGKRNYNKMIQQQKAIFPNIKVEAIRKFNNKKLYPQNENFENENNFDINFKETFDKLSGLKLK